MPAVEIDGRYMLRIGMPTVGKSAIGIFWVGVPRLE